MIKIDSTIKDPYVKYQLEIIINYFESEINRLELKIRGLE